ncbi:hypothetical protein Ancab_000422 [Ancistrocladus abbreviatus]
MLILLNVRVFGRSWGGSFVKTIFDVSKGASVLLLGDSNEKLDRHTPEFFGVGSLCWKWSGREVLSQRVQHFQSWLFLDSVVCRKKEGRSCQWLKMDAEALQSELLALKKLYGLLTISTDSQQNAISEILDANSRLYLKKLLDRAAEGLFEAHSKIMAASLSMIAESCSNQLDKSKQSARLHSSVSPCNLMINKDSVGIATAQKAMQSSTELNPKTILSDPSRLSSPANEAQNRKKRCWACERNNMQQLITAQKIKGPSEKAKIPSKDFNPREQQQGFGSKRPVEKLESKEAPELVKSNMLKKNRSCKVIRSLSGAGSVTCSTSSVADGAPRLLDKKNVSTVGKQKAQQLNDFSEEVDAKTKIIESLTSSLKLSSQPACMPNEDAAGNLGSPNNASSILHADLFTPSEKIKYGVTRSELSQTGKPLVHGHDLLVSPRQNEYDEQASALLSPKPNLKFLLSKDGMLATEDVKLLNNAENHSSRQGPFTCNSQSKPAVAGQWAGSINDYSFQDGSLGWFQKSSGLENETLIWRTSQIPRQNVRTSLQSIESVSQPASPIDMVACQTPEYIQALRISPIQFGKDGKTLVQTPHPKAIRRSVASRPPPATAPSIGSAVTRSGRVKETGDSDCKLTRIQSRGRCVPQNSLPQWMIRKATSAYKQSPANASVTNKKSRIQQNIDTAQPSKVQPYHLESDETSWVSPSSSSWTGQQSNSYTSSSRTAQPTSSSSGENEFEYSNSQYAGPPSGRMGRMACESSSDYDASSDSSWDHYSHVGPLHRVDLTKASRPNHQANREGGAGRLRRLKNKLGMIFHHHHHHHHHHHDESDEDEVGHGKSFWKQFGKMFQHERKEDLEKSKVVKSRKPITKSVKKQQGGHFQALVHGLMRHVRHSKKSNPAKEAIKTPVNARLGGKKAVKKLHCWQQARGQQGVKLPNKARVKLGSKTKRPQLPAAKTL